MSVEIHHLGIAVRSLPESLRFYCELIGLPAAGEEVVAAEQVKVALLPASASTKGARIELLEATAETSAIAKFIEKNGPGLHHVALAVDDIDATAARLAAEGCQVLGQPQTGAGGHRYVFVHPKSAGGVLLELVSRD